MKAWIENIHKKTVQIFGLDEMFEKLITELFELQLKVYSHKLDIVQIIEEISDCHNMIDKLELFDIDFEFASPLDLKETIKVLSDRHLLAPLQHGHKLQCAPRQLLNGIALQFKLDPELIEAVMLVKMKRTAERMDRDD